MFGLAGYKAGYTFTSSKPICGLIKKAVAHYLSYARLQTCKALCLRLLFCEKEWDYYLVTLKNYLL
jgi:hypothetical protein